MIKVKTKSDMAVKLYKPTSPDGALQCDWLLVLIKQNEILSGRQRNTLVETSAVKLLFATRVGVLKRIRTVDFSRRQNEHSAVNQTVNMTQPERFILLAYKRFPRYILTCKVWKFTTKLCNAEYVNFL